MSFKKYMHDFQHLLNTIDETEVLRLGDAICGAYRAGRTVFVVGNGGSGANASHLCEDLGKGTITDFDKQKRLRIISLTDNAPYLLAWANDTSFERIFVEQLKNLALPGDLLIAISGSGNSPNILAAVEFANTLGMRTFGVTGYDGGKLLGFAQDSIYVKSFDMGMVEAAHGVVFHYLTGLLKTKFAQ
ncbi:MAG TPA: SIS domain-containing protein [Candidatus Bathyarchaeia archaeon]|nr:SIS domain-containing protein [Candidatus Bathyarchaeia archaeon]